MWQKIMLGVGILGLMLGGLVLVGTTVLVATGAGHISGDEALPGYIGGCFCMFVSVVIGVVGLVLVMKNRKKPVGGVVEGGGPPV